MSPIKKSNKLFYSAKILKFSLITVLLLTGLVFVKNSQVSAACSVQSPDLGSATQTVNIPANGTYRVWSRITAADSTANSYLLEVDGGTCVTVGDYSIPANTWTWVDYQAGNTSNKLNLSLTAGNHTIKMVGREAGVKLDKVIFTADTTCVPTGTGDNCVIVTDTTPPTVSITSPANGATVSGQTTFSANASDASGINKVELYVDNSLLKTEMTSPYSIQLDTTTLSNGTHTLGAKAYDTVGNSSTLNTITITVNNQSASQADLVITSVDSVPANITDGNLILFRAVVKNQGTASTPLGVKHGVRFDIDGKVVSWHGNDTTTSIAPGESIVMSANNGPSGSPYWTATAGSHTLQAYVDDLQLINESDDNNNILSKSLVVTSPTDTQPPTVPTGVQATATSATQVNVTWQASTDNTGVTGYWISRDGVAIAQTTGTSYTDSNVQPAGTYTYAVSAYDAALNASSYSAGVKVQTPQAPDTSPPSAPTALFAIPLSSSQINLTWTASTDNIGVASYDVYQSVGGGQASKIASVATTSFASTGLNTATDYTYYVVAKDAAGNLSPQSNSATATTFSTTQNGNIYGFVRNNTGKAIKNATVRVAVNGSILSTKTSSRGNYLMTNIPENTYDFTYNANGYALKQVQFTILPDTTIPGNVNLDRK